MDLRNPLALGEVSGVGRGVGEGDLKDSKNAVLDTPGKAAQLVLGTMNSTRYCRLPMSRFL